MRTFSTGRVAAREPGPHVCDTVGREVATIDVESVGEALAISVQAGVPVLLRGSPGTGTTAVVRALGEALCWPTEVVIGSFREPADFAGLPVVIDRPAERNTNITKYRFDPD